MYELISEIRDQFELMSKEQKCKLKEFVTFLGSNSKTEHTEEPVPAAQENSP
jgi:Ca2+-binding EF-hand superfamily protein